MTAPGGVPNLPIGALTPENLADRIEDMSTAGMRAITNERYAGIFTGSNGGNPASNITPFGILNGIFAGAYAAVANADPADIQGPEDIPNVWEDFITDLPMTGQPSLSRIDDIEERLEALEGGTP